VKPLLILGTGTFAEEIADVAADSGEFEIAGYVENLDRARCSETIGGHIVHWIDDIGAMTSTHLAICGLGTTHRRKFTDQAAAMGMRFATVIHPGARVSSRSSLGEGTVVSAGVIIAAHTHVGRHVIVNRGALIGHHTAIGDYTSVMSGANIAGNCTIGEASYLGMGCIVINNLTVGKSSLVGAGAVVTRSVPDNVEVLGMPARVTRENINGK
jgi:sugar O-acyltransferase (sialic acid O-acetyltransferase NeuD family)